MPAAISAPTAPLNGLNITATSGTLTVTASSVLQQAGIQIGYTGGSLSMPAGATAANQYAATGNQANATFARYSDTATTSPNLFIGRARGTTPGTNTVVQSGDLLGVVNFAGADGSTFVAAATIRAEVDGTPGSTDMPGRLIIATTADGASSVTDRLTFDNTGNIVVGTAAIATNAANGFLYIPSCAGPPTGTPTTKTGRVPLVVDTTNHKLYFYDVSWRDAGP